MLYSSGRNVTGHSVLDPDIESAARVSRFGRLLPCAFLRCRPAFALRLGDPGAPCGADAAFRILLCGSGTSRLCSHRRLFLLYECIPHFLQSCEFFINQGNDCTTHVISPKTILLCARPFGSSRGSDVQTHSTSNCLNVSITKKQIPYRTFLLTSDPKEWILRSYADP